MKSLQSERSSHSEIDDRRMSLPGQPTESLEGKEPRAWISKEKWGIYIKGDTDADRRTPSDVSIFRVPTTLKEQKKEAYYVPKIVSLGLYHHRSEKLAPMGRHKGTALRRMMTRSNTRHGNFREFSDSAKEEIAKLEKIKDSYEEDICCAGETLAMMLTLDGCFILEILRTMIGDELEEASKYYDPIFGTNKIEYTGNDILCDILKLENQIPLIVLQHLQQLDLKLKSYDFLAFLEEALLRIFNPFRYDTTKWCAPQRHEQELEPVHLLDLLHGLIVSSPCHHNHEDQIELDIFCSCCNRNQATDLTQVKTGEYRSIRQATDLRNAGINFRTCSEGIKQIIFESKIATICLPPITIDGNTEVLFRNLIAFEMCKPSKTNYVASYVILMSDLIDSNEDVALLRKMGIITNQLGSDAEVAQLFNGLCKGVIVSDNAFDQLAPQVNTHYNSKINIQIAKLVEERFFWFSGATVLFLLLAIVQTIYTIISVYKK